MEKAFIIVRMKDPGDIYAFIALGEDIDRLPEEYSMIDESYHIEELFAESIIEVDGKLILTLDKNAPYHRKSKTNLPYMYR